MRPSKHLFAAVAAVCAAASPFALGQSAAPAPVVKSIEVQFAGPAAISKERILANMRTQIGRPYSDTAVSEDIHNLYSTGNISNVRIFGEPQGDGVKVIVVVQTKANVKEVRLEGITQVKPKAIRKQLVTKPGERMTDANLETDRQKILDFYADRGFKDTAVEYKVDTDPKTNKNVVTFNVTEGGKTIIRHIRFEGNTVFRAKVLRKLLKTKTHNMLSFITKAGQVKSELLDEDVAAIREFYQNHGYLDVQIAEPQVERVDKRADVDLVFSINEGRLYHVGKVSVSGGHLFTADEVYRVLKVKPDAIYSPKAVNDDVKAIQDLYGARGYIDTQVTPETTPGGTDVNNLLFRIDEGSQSYINRINISGNTRTRDKVIRRELAVAPGEVYNSVRVDASKTRLQNLNYFEHVDTFASDTGIPGKKDLNVVVAEKRTGSLNFGAGYSTVDGLLGFVELTQSNFSLFNWPSFTGDGERFRTRIQYGTDRKDYTLSLTEPYFLDYQLAVGGELFFHEADYLSDVYNQKNYGFDLFARKALDEFTSLRLDYRLEDVKVYDVNSEYNLLPVGPIPPLPANATRAYINARNNAINTRNYAIAYNKQLVETGIYQANAAGSQLKSQLGPTLTYDTRDSVFLTRKGTRAEITTYLAGGPLGADVKIYGIDAQAAHYISLPWDTILTLDSEFAVVSGWDGSNSVPIYDRLYLGGANNLRGFNFRDVGPRDQFNESEGGDTMARMTVEYTYPIIDRVRGAVFYDAGMLCADNYSFKSDDLASDAGLGLRLDLPIGPIRLDYGIPTLRPSDPNQKVGSGGHFNFNIGYQF